MRQLMKTIAAGALAIAALTGTAAAQQIAIVNAKIYMAGPSDNPQTIEQGGIIINNGRISAVGANVVAPSGAKVIDAGGQPVTPGFIAAYSSLGLEEISLNGEGNDSSADGDFPLSAALDAEDALNPDSSVIAINRVGGITRAYVTHQAGGKLFGGCGAVIDLSGAVDPVTSSCVAQNVVMGYSGARRAGDSRAGAMALLRLYLEEAALYRQNPADYRFLRPASDLNMTDLDALSNYLGGEKPLLVHVQGAADIRRIIDLGEEYNLDLILYGASEAWRVANELAAADIPVIINPMSNLPGSFERMGATLENAARLERAGVTVAYADGDTHNLRLLPQLAGNAVANGASFEAALAALTVHPAEILGLGDRLGTLQAGKVADVVVWDGDPLELSSGPVAVLINGRETSMETRQSLLAKRYKDLGRGEKPHAYRGSE